MQKYKIKQLFLGITMVITFVILLEMGVRFLYEDYRSYHLYARLDYYEELGQIDTIFCGTSRTYSGINPAIYDDYTLKNSFNMATSAQDIQSTYYIIKDALRCNPIKTVFLEVSIATLFASDDDKGRITAAERIYTPLGKLEAALSESSSNLQFQYLFYSTQVENYFDLTSVRRNLRYKLSKNGGTVPSRTSRDSMHYITRGFYSSSKIYDGSFNGRIKERYIWDRSKVTSENLEYIQKILTLCEKHEVEVILYSPPISEPVLPFVGDLADMHSYYQEIADAYQVDFYDMNYLSDSLEYFPNEGYRDSMHLNVYGAKVLTRILADVEAYTFLETN